MADSSCHAVFNINWVAERQAREVKSETTKLSAKHYIAHSLGQCSRSAGSLDKRLNGGDHFLGG